MEILTNENVILLPPSEQPLFLFVSTKYILELYISKFSQYAIIKNSFKKVAVNLIDFISCVKVKTCSCLLLKYLGEKEILEFIEEFLNSLPRPKKLYIIRKVK